jgi:acyl-CoA reductase-like NAD-dependent aldehyde dehydrogenase
VTIQVAAAQSGLKRCCLELGGNAPLVVCEDFNLSDAADIAMSCFSNSGQSCTSTRRVYVHEANKRAFLQELVSRVKKWRVGHALDPGTQQGPVISGVAMDRIITAVRDAQKRGGSVVVGGYRATLPAGYFIPPTIVADLPPTDPLVVDELFGPVMVLRTYTTLDDVIAESQRSRYGLSANVLTNLMPVAERMTNALPAGTVWINGADVMNPATPFGGTRLSGYGKDLGAASLESYSQMKTVITVHR